MSGTGVEEVRTALKAMADGGGDFEAVKAAVEAARFPAKGRWDMESSDRDFVQDPDCFERVVTPAAVTKVIDRNQWKELMALWKANPPAEAEAEAEAPVEEGAALPAAP